VVLGAVSRLIEVVGTGFVPTSVLDVNGQARSTVYVSATQVEVNSDGADVAATGKPVVDSREWERPRRNVRSCYCCVNNPRPGVPLSLSPSMVATGPRLPRL